MYPTIEQVETADRYQLCKWYRFLHGPGAHAIGKANFSSICEAEAKIMDRIVERTNELGGFTPEISKALG